MPTFDADPRKQQEARLRGAIDRIYKWFFGDVKIKRFDKTDDYLLDQKFAIDVRITLLNGMVFTCQEKALSASMAKYESITVEYFQNYRTGEYGDWFKLSPQFYFVGYEDAKNRGHFCKYILIDWTRLQFHTLHDRVPWQQRKNKDGVARASFKFVRFGEIPQDAIYLWWDKNRGVVINRTE